MSKNNEQLDPLPANTPAADLLMRVRDKQRGKDFRVDFGQVAGQGGNPATNFQPGGPFRVTNRAQADPNYTAGNTTRDGIPNALLCINAPATVEFDPAGNDKEYVVKYDGAPRVFGSGMQAFKDGTCTGATLPAKWVRRESVRALTPYGSIDGATYKWRVNDYSSEYVGTPPAEQFFKYVGPDNQVAPAPTGDPVTDADVWEVVSFTDIPVVAQTPFYQAILTADAQQRQANGENIDPLLYRILRGSAGSPATRRGDVLVQGIVQSPATTVNDADVPAQFATDGQWLNPATDTWVRVLYDVATDTVVPLNFALLSPVVVAEASGGFRGFSSLAEATAIDLTDAVITLSAAQDAPGLDLGAAGALRGGGVFVGATGSARTPAKTSETNLGGFLLNGLFFDCQIGQCTVPTGSTAYATDCAIISLTVAGTLVLRAGTQVPSTFFSTFTRQPDGSYTTPAGGTVVDERGGTALVTLDPYISATGPIGAAVTAGTFTNGELQGAQPAGSQAGMEFTTTTYGYKYQRGAAGALVWCRYPKL